MNWELITLPVVAAIIGWGTNVIAIRMLFLAQGAHSHLGFEFWVSSPSEDWISPEV